MSGDRAIRGATAAVVMAVAAFAAIVSYSHIFDLGRTHGASGTAARLLPLSVDGLILAMSLVLLHEARNDREAPTLARLMLWLGIGATMAANALYGRPWGALGAVINTWPAVAFLGTVHAVTHLVRVSRGGRAGTVPAPLFTDAQTAAMEAYARSVAGGNPFTSNALAGKFRLSRAEAAKVVEAVTVAANGQHAQQPAETAAAKGG